MSLISFCLLVLSQDSAGLCCLSARQYVELAADSRLIKTPALFGYLRWSFWLHRLGFLPSVRFRKGFYLAHSQNPGAAWIALRHSDFHVGVSGYCTETWLQDFHSILNSFVGLGQKLVYGAA